MGGGASKKSQQKYQKGSAAASESSSAGQATSSLPRKSTTHIIIRNTDHIGEVYDLLREPISKGAFSKVRLATNKKTRVNRAVKCLPRPRTQKRHQYSNAVVSAEEFEHEVSVMGMLDHPNIVRPLETFQDYLNSYLVMEYCEGGELLDALVTLEVFTERRAATVMSQVFSGVAYMHSQGVCHRDIRPRNLLLLQKTMIKDCTIKIVDFGSACILDASGNMTETRGERYYRAPEIDGRTPYTVTCDTWSCGVVTYTLLCGFHVSKEAKEEARRESFRNAAKGHFSFKSEDLQDRTPEAQDLLRQLLTSDGRSRLTASAARQHAWIQVQGGQGSDVPMNQAQLNSLKEYATHNALKKRALHVIAQRLEDSQIRKLKDMFASMDQNKDGMITYQEMRTALMETGINVPRNLKEIMEEMDANGSNVIDYTEFVAAALQKRHYTEQNICLMAFRAIDKDGTGKISKKNIKDMLIEQEASEYVGQEQIDKVLDECEQDGDGEIDFDEFLALMRRRS